MSKAIGVCCLSIIWISCALQSICASRVLWTAITNCLRLRGSVLYYSVHTLGGSDYVLIQFFIPAVLPLCSDSNVHFRFTFLATHRKQTCRERKDTEMHRVPQAALSTMGGQSSLVRLPAPRQPLYTPYMLHACWTSGG